jgi:hypothetical protein
MQTLKPIEKWKFTLQIVLVSLILLLTCVNGVRYIITEVTNERSWKYQSINAYTQSFLWMALLIFQMLLFQSYPKIKNLFLWFIILRLVSIGYGFIEQAFITIDLDILQILSAIDGILQLISTIIGLVLYGHILSKRYNKAPLVKMFKPYAIITIIMDCIGFLFSILLPIAITFVFELNKLWGLAFFFHTVPLVFLIIYYIKIKEIYSTLRVDDQPTVDAEKPWPPEAAKS